MNSSFFNNNDGNNSFSGTQVLSQQGGGFMNSSFASDMAGGENTTSGTGQSRVGVPNEASLLPCTIKQIQSAPLPAKDDSFRIDGKEVHNATIVGRIVHINVESTHTSYTIDDGTGQIDVRVWTTVNESKNNNENDNSNDNGNNNNKDEDENSGFEMNMYVRCIGKIKVYQENINFNGYKMRKIIDHNEITYHNLEAIFAHLVNQDPIKARNILSQNKPNPVNQSRNTINNNNNNNNMNNNRMGNSNSNSNNNGNNNGSMAGMNNNMNNMSMNNGNGNNNDGGNMMIEEDNRERSPLEIAILQFLRRSEDANEKNSSYDGCHVDKILAAFDDNQRNEIRELLDHMSSDGTIYSTVDDEHFRTSQ